MMPAGPRRQQSRKMPPHSLDGHRRGPWRRQRAGPGRRPGGRLGRSRLLRRRGVRPQRRQRRSRLPWRARRVEQRQEELHERADADGEQHGADADRSAEQPADRQHGQLDAGADQAQGAPGTAGQARHQPVAGSGAETGADVHAAGQPAEQDPAEHLRNAPWQRGAAWQQRQRHVHRAADEHDVADRAETRPLPQRDPAQQHDRPDDDRDRADRQPGVGGDALVQHVPGVKAES